MVHLYTDYQIFVFLLYLKMIATQSNLVVCYLKWITYGDNDV